MDCTKIHIKKKRIMIKIVIRFSEMVNINILHK